MALLYICIHLTTEKWMLYGHKNWGVKILRGSFFLFFTFFLGFFMVFSTFFFFFGGSLDKSREPDGFPRFNEGILENIKKAGIFAGHARMIQNHGKWLWVAGKNPCLFNVFDGLFLLRYFVYLTSLFGNNPFSYTSEDTSLLQRLVSLKKGLFPNKEVFP